MFRNGLFVLHFSFYVAIGFNHRSVFPVVFSSGVVQKWWNGMLFFRLYCRSPGERMVR